MADVLTGTMNEMGSSDLYASTITSLRLLPHPLTCLAHVAFKVAIIIAYFILPYIFGSITGSYPDFILTFEFTGLLVLADYWTVKNCTASTLAGIAWYCDTSVSNEFVYKTVKDAMFINRDESKFFWSVMYIWPAPWVLNIVFRLTTIDIPSFILSVLIFSAALLNLMNCIKCSQGGPTYECSKCRVEKRTKTSQITGQVAGKLMNFVMMAKTKRSFFPN